MEFLQGTKRSCITRGALQPINEVFAKMAIAIRVHVLLFLLAAIIDLSTALHCVQISFQYKTDQK